MSPNKYDGKEFTSLHAHSFFSIRDGISSIKDIVKKAVENKMPAVCLTEHGTMASAIHLYNECKKNGIKPILGVEAYIANRSRLDKVPNIDKYYHITLIAMNMTGWKNLSTLIGLSHQEENKYNKPRIDRELLRRYNEGIICLSGCYGGNLAYQIRHDLMLETSKMYMTAYEIMETCEEDDPCRQQYQFATESAQDVVDWYKNVFGDRYYIEIQKHNMGKTEDLVIERLFELAEENNIRYVITTDSHYIEPQDKEVHDIMLASGRGITVNDEKWNTISYYGNNYHMMTYSELAAIFPNHIQGLDESINIVNRCNIEFEFGNYRIPSQLDDMSKENQVFIDAIYAGMIKRFGENITEEILERTQMEIDTMIRMALPSYFLMIAEYMEWAKENQVPMGVGRGSGAGSIVNYLLGITEVNPLEYNLYFSRFLNAGRASIPIISFEELPYDEFKRNNNEQ